ncbi:MAG: hypothetical protein DI587_36320 [Variovorax paradoxus]|nr:MAG: hypothetical protein DI583_36320 [Variovorax paradoxus]PZQ00772.1 MAG: hypothetical protein DI587_36320 [Variovorax paradoxus]
MTTATEPRDYLGHPCDLSRLHVWIDEGLDDTRKMHPEDGDPRALPRVLGRSLRLMLERAMRMTAALHAIRREVPNDSDGSHALLDMATEYSVETESRMQSLAALVLLALERGPGYPDHLRPDAEGGVA